MNSRVLALALVPAAALGQARGTAWERAIGGSDVDQALAVATSCDSIYVGGGLEDDAGVPEGDGGTEDGGSRQPRSALGWSCACQAGEGPLLLALAFGLFVVARTARRHT
jgi:MYXO-CTERM domain-containing protein